MRERNSGSSKFFFSFSMVFKSFNNSYSKRNLTEKVFSGKKNFLLNISFMVEPLLSGIVLGLVPVTIAGLFVTAYLQYRRGDQATW